MYACSMLPMYSGQSREDRFEFDIKRAKDFSYCSGQRVDLIFLRCIFQDVRVMACGAHPPMYHG